MDEKVIYRKKIVFIVLYFGMFPNFFSLFLKSCEANDEYCDWIIFTDDHSNYEYPVNVRTVYISWDRMRSLIQDKFEFTISLEKPYKLCDFKVAFGYIFEDYITDYEYWGYCDVDLIWGSFKNFWNDDLLKNYKKVFNLGHCTIYHNDAENNRIFLKLLDGKERYREVFTCPQNCSFDEEYSGSINNIYELCGIPIFEKSYAANLYTKSSNFRLTKMKHDHKKYKVEKNKKRIFIWKRGQLFCVYRDKEIKKEEYLYIHFQSRPMKLRICTQELEKVCEYKIIPNSFDRLEIPLEKIDRKNFGKIKRKHFNMHYFRLRGKNFVSKIKKRLEK